MINSSIPLNFMLNNSTLNMSMLLNDPNVVITTWTMINKFAGFVFILGMVFGYGLAKLKSSKTSED